MNNKRNITQSENLKNTINERMQNFMFNPYTFQKRNGFKIASINDFGLSSNNHEIDNQIHTNHSTHHSPHQSNSQFYQQNNYHQENTSSFMFDNNKKFNKMKKNTNDRQTNYNSLSRNLDLSNKKFVPFYEHRPIDTTQEYLEDPKEYS